LAREREEVNLVVKRIHIIQMIIVEMRVNGFLIVKRGRPPWPPCAKQVKQKMAAGPSAKPKASTTDRWEQNTNGATIALEGRRAVSTCFR
jgi:hypothetical protein